MNRLITTLVLALGCAVAPAQAQMNNAMTKMFNEQGNVTTPGVAMGQTRGVITMGGASVRSPIVRADLGVHMDLPSVSAGCGGIDIQGGALSFPSAQRFVDVARAVAANAKGYAFKLALGAVCQHCESKLTEIQEMINKIGLGNVNSCELAQQALAASGATNAITSWGEELGKTIGTNNGSSSDRYAASEANTGVNPTQAAYKDDPAAMQQAAVGNFIWEALKRGNLGKWFGSSDSKQFREEMMSITGTVVTCVAGQDGCPGGKDGSDKLGMVTMVLPPQLRLIDLVSLTPSENRKVWTCPDDACYGPKEAHRSDDKTLAEEVRDAYLGSDGNPGIIGTISMRPDAAPDLSDEQWALIQASGNVGAIIQTLASKPSTVVQARMLADSFAPIIAATFLERTLSSAMNEVQSLVANDPRPSAAQARSQIVEVSRGMAEDLSKLMQMSAEQQRLFQTSLLAIKSGQPVSVLSVM